MDNEHKHEGRRLDPRSTDELIQAALSEEDEDAAWDLVGILQHRGTREVLEAARRLTESGDPRERSLGADILGQSRAPEKTFHEQSLAILLGMLETDRDPDVLSDVATALGHLQDERAVEPLVKLKNHPSEDVRFGVVFGLNGLQNDSAISALIELSNDVDEDVRNWATFGIGSLTEKDSEEIREALLRRLDEQDHEIRGEALVGLAERGDERVVEPLLKELSSGDVSALAVEAAGDIAHPALYQALLRMKEWWDLDQELLDEAIEACRPK